MNLKYHETAREIVENIVSGRESALTPGEALTLAQDIVGALEKVALQARAEEQENQIKTMKELSVSVRRMMTQ